MVKVYALNICEFPDPKECPEILYGLNEKRIRKILRCKQPMGRKQRLGAGLLLKQCLENNGLSEQEIVYGDNGKPEIEGMHFNLSHSGEIVVCALSNETVGCDIEIIANMREGMAQRFFTEKEIHYLNSFHKEEKTEEFYRLWTMKESYMKMTGEGMKLALNRFEFLFDDKIQVYRDGSLQACNIKEYDVPGYKLTVCTEDTAFADDIVFVKLLNGSIRLLERWYRG